MPANVRISTLALVSLLLLLLATLASSLKPAEVTGNTANSPSSANDYHQRDWQDFKEFQEFRAWKRSKSAKQHPDASDDASSESDESDESISHEVSDDDGEVDRPIRGGGHNQRQREHAGRWKHRRDDPEEGHRSGKKNDGGSKRIKSVDGVAVAGDGRASKKKERRNQSGGDEPPPIDQAALMARYIVNQAAWTSVATISSRKDIKGYPFTNVNSVSDGPLGNGTGVPYLYLTPLDFTAQDIYNDNRATLSMTLAQGQYCQAKDYDPMDPRCARVVLSGKIKEIKESSPEHSTAKSAVFGRHPWLAHMPADHHFFFAKLKIASIAVLDTFGGPKYVSVKDYLNPTNSSALAESYNHYQTFLQDNSMFAQPLVSMNV